MAPVRAAAQRPERPGGLFRRNGAAPALLPHSGNENIRADLTRFLQSVPNTVVLTMPTALNRRIIDQDLSSYLVEGDYEHGFRFLGKLPYRKDGQRWALEHIEERNAITREVCAKLGVRMIDLAAALATDNLSRFPRKFSRRGAYPPPRFPQGGRNHP